MSLRSLSKILFIGFLVVLSSVKSLSGQFTGLRFDGQNVPLDMRTGLNLTPDKPLEFKNRIVLQFELKYQPSNADAYFGYIFRALINDQNFDLICSPELGMNDNFNFIIGNEISDISFNVPFEELNSRWIPFTLTIDARKQYISLTADGQSYEQSFQLDNAPYELILLFGEHRYGRYSSTDLPNMNMREITLVTDNKQEYYWPLDQYTGTVAREVNRGFHGRVTNPNWIANLHTNWEQTHEFEFPGQLSFTYNPVGNELFFLLQDSLVSLDLNTGHLKTLAGSVNYTPGFNAQLAFDTSSQQLVCYSVDRRDKVVLSTEPFPESEGLSNPYLTRHWHHNNFIDPLTGRLMVFGGYGQYKYSNEVLVFNDARKDWDTIDYQGTFHPRYLAGLGYDPLNRQVFIMGGFGSIKGRQAITPGYYHDLLSYSLEEQSFETLATFDEEEETCFANNLHYDTLTQTLYGLRFSKLETNPMVQAVAVPLDDPEMIEVGNTFQFPFLDIKSYINLYYNKTSNKLLAVNSFFEGESTTVNIHQVAYPPLTIAGTEEEPAAAGKNYLDYMVIGAAAVMLVLVVVFWIRKRKKRSRVQDPDGVNEAIADDENGENFHVHPKERVPGSILIFGGFQVIDRQGKDITKSFSPLVKELFLYIMLTSLRYDKGVSSSSINDVFWPDKSSESAKNNRTVNIAKIRTLLEKVGDCSISKETGYWKFSFNPDRVYIDYHEYLDLLNNKKLKTRDGIYSLLQLIYLGPALQNVQSDWLDDFKSSISNEIIDSILEFIHTRQAKSEPKFIIHLANCIFFFDMANEEAMTVKCQTLVSLGKHSLAKKAYERFVKEYEHLYGEKYTTGFNQIIEGPQ